MTKSLKWSSRWDISTIPLEIKRQIHAEIAHIDGAKGGRPRIDDPATEEKRKRERERVKKFRAKKRLEKQKSGSQKFQEPKEETENQKEGL